MGNAKICAFLLAVIAFGVCDTSGAWAHEYQVNLLTALHIVFKEILELGTTNRLHGTPFAVTIQIQCEHRHVSGYVVLGILGEMTLEFSSCTVEKPANCTIKEPVVWDAFTELEESGGAFLIKLTPRSGTTFTEFTLEGASCSLKGKPFKIEGTQTLEMPEGGVDLIVHVLIGKASGSALTAGGKAATFESSAMSLETESGWYGLETETFGASQEWDVV